MTSTTSLEILSWPMAVRVAILSSFSILWSHIPVGTSLLLKHKGSVHSILAEAYPEHKWVAFRFSRVPTDYWKRVKASYNNDALRDYLIWLGEQYCGIKFSGNETSDSKELEKWYTVTRTTLPSGSKQMLQQFGGLVKALQTAFPSHPWNPKLFQSKEGTKHQHHLSEITGRMFPSLCASIRFSLRLALFLLNFNNSIMQL